MKSIIVTAYLFAATNVRYQENLKGTNVFYIDGYNVLGHAGTANNSTALTTKLSQIVEPRSNTIILVFDGPKAGKTTTPENASSAVPMAADATTTPSITIPVDDDTASIESSSFAKNNVSPSTAETTPTTPTTTTVEVAETTIEILNPYGTFQKVTLGTGLLADDYILNEISAMGRDSHHHHHEQDAASTTTRNVVQVVTADRKLRQQVLAIKPNKVKGVINPVTFWKRYIPRLCGLKNK